MTINKHTEAEEQREFDDIYEELFEELEKKYGKLDELHVCENPISHLSGNAYLKFRSMIDAEIACVNLNNRWFNR
jgi:splicing factor U2AF subunit